MILNWSRTGYFFLKDWRFQTPDRLTPLQAAPTPRDEIPSLITSEASAACFRLLTSAIPIAMSAEPKRIFTAHL